MDLNILIEILKLLKIEETGIDKVLRPNIEN